MVNNAKQLAEAAVSQVRLLIEEPESGKAELLPLIQALQSRGYQFRGWTPERQALMKVDVDKISTGEDVDCCANVYLSCTPPHDTVNVEVGGCKRYTIHGANDAQSEEWGDATKAPDEIELPLSTPVGEIADAIGDAVCDLEFSEFHPKQDELLDPEDFDDSDR